MPWSGSPYLSSGGLDVQGLGQRWEISNMISESNDEWHRAAKAIGENDTS